MILTDHPINESEKDLLKRKPLAYKIAEIVKEYDGNDSFVIGIEGEWGSGKTSFVNMSKEVLSESDDVILIDFNPWNFANQDEIIKDFFLHLSNKLESKGIKVGRQIWNYSKKLLSLGLSITSLLESKTSISSKIKGFLNRDKPQKSLDEERLSLNKDLGKIKKKIIIVIDDIDRLDEKETKLVMKLVKLTANFPNTIFLLCYDREKTASKISSIPGEGDEYLKKIVQVTFTIPKITDEGLQNILFSNLEEVIKKIYSVERVDLKGDDKKRWDSLIYDGLLKPFKTIRDINRYTTSLALNWSIIGKDEVNIIDFMAIELIRVFTPSLYSDIVSNKSLFVDGVGELMSSYNLAGKKVKEEKFEEIINKLPKEMRDIMRKVCQELFPRLKGGYQGSDWTDVWLKEKRMCTKDRFDFYSQLTIPNGQLSQIDVRSFLEANIQTKEGQEYLSNMLIKLSEEGKLRKMLVEISLRMQDLNKEKAFLIIYIFWTLDFKIKDQKTSAFDFNSVEDQIRRLSFNFIKSIKTDEEKIGFIKRLAIHDNIYQLSRLSIDILKNKFVLSIKEETAKEIIDISIKKIYEAIDKDSLKNESRFLYLVYFLKQNDPQNADNKIKDYVKKLISTQQGLILFIKSFVSRVYSSSGDYNTLNRNNIREMYDDIEISKLVDSISNDEIINLSQEDKEALDLYKEDIKDAFGPDND